MKVCDPGSNPPACSSCGQAKPDERHVDFGAAWEGPVFNQLDVVALGVTPITIDDLKVCETCVRAAAEELKLDDISAPAIDALRRQIDTLLEQNRGQGGYIEQLQRTIQAKPKAKAA